MRSSVIRWIEHATDRSFREVVDVVKEAAWNIYNSPIPQLAAALSFRTIFALIPTLVVAIVVVQFFVGEETLRSAIKWTLNYTGISAIHVGPLDDEDAEAQRLVREARAAEGDPPPGAEAGADEPAAAPAPSDDPGGRGDASRGGSPAGTGPPASDPVPEIKPAQRAAEAAAVVEQLVQRVRNLPYGRIGFGGFLLLVYTAIALLVELEHAFNQIYRAPTGRSWTRRIMQYWTLLTLGALGLAATLWVGNLAADYLRGLISGEAGDRTSTLAVSLVGFLITVIISTVLLLFVYMTMPNASVAFKHALAGAFVAAILWESSKWGFTQYLKHSTGYTAYYGQLALIPLFVFWVYITWVIVLFGLQISYSLQAFGTWSQKKVSDERPEQAIVDPAMIVPVVAAIARRFGSGQACDMSEITMQAGVPATVSARMLERLQRAGYIHRLASDMGSECFALARAPADINVADLLAIGHDLAPHRDDTRSGPVLAKLRECQFEAARPLTIGDIVEAKAEPHVALELPPEAAAESAEPPPEPPAPPGPDAAPARDDPAPPQVAARGGGVRGSMAAGARENT